MADPSPTPAEPQPYSAEELPGIIAGLRAYAAGCQSEGWPNEAEENFRVAATLSSLLEDQKRLARFVGKFVVSAREHGGGSAIDGGEAQDWMVENGILESRRVTEACGEDCGCAEWDDFPQDCFFVSDLGQRCIDAARTPLQPQQKKEG